MDIKQHEITISFEEKRFSGITGEEKRPSGLRKK